MYSGDIIKEHNRDLLEENLFGSTYVIFFLLTILHFKNIDYDERKKKNEILITSNLITKIDNA